MKKFINSMWISLCLFALVSCGGVDSKIDDYEAALKDGETEKAVKILEKLKDEDLTSEQEERIMTISAKYATDEMSKFGKMFDDASDMIDKGSKMMDDASKMFDNSSDEN